MSRTPIETDAGWAAFDHNYYRGRSLRDVLACDSNWSIVSLALGGPRLDAAQSTLLDGLSIALSAPDPRIWPVKMVWLAGCNGSPYAAMACAQLFVEGSFIGPGTATAAARMWQAMRSALGGAPSVDDVAAWLSDQGKRIPGFGTPGRSEDERLPLLHDAVRRYGSRGPHYELCCLAEDAARGGRAPLNAIGAFAACALDLGIPPDRVSTLTHFCLCTPLWAHAVDSSSLPASNPLRHLDRDAISYAGPPPRRSPRYLASSTEATKPDE